jgi:enoyl-[acyl-carrier-protein] reductase (NADH)
MLNDLRGKAVLITGGTRGIGLATGLAFGRQGAEVTLTHKWGSADEDEIRRAFAAAGAPEPAIVAADAREEADTLELLQGIRRRHERLEILVSGVAFAQVVKSLEDYSKRSFSQSMEYTVWPLAGYLQGIQSVFGSYPRYAVALSSDGPDGFVINYDVVAACKAALETLSRYLAHRLLDHDTRVNVIRARYVPTQSFESTVGPEFKDFVERYDPNSIVAAEAVAGAVLALCSGLMDSVTGQIIMVDNGSAFSDNIMGMHERWRGQPPQSNKE